MKARLDMMTLPKKVAAHSLVISCDLNYQAHRATCGMFLLVYDSVGQCARILVACETGDR